LKTLSTYTSHKSIFLILIFLFFRLVLTGQTSGELTVTITTSSSGGNYAPKNIVAIWIENSTGQFVKTLLAYAQTRITHLNTWQAATNAVGSEFNRTDAITGATQSGHGIRTCKWNGTDYNGALMTDGNYTLKMELTDKNETGNYSSISFTKGSTSQTLNPSNTPSFSSIGITWIPSVATGLTDVTNFEISFYPNPGSGIYTLIGNNIKEVEVKTLTGNTVFKGNTNIIDICKHQNGTYLVLIKTTEGSVVKKLIKN